MLVASRFHLKGIDNKQDYLIGMSALPLPRDGAFFNSEFNVLPCPWKTSSEIEHAIHEVNNLYEDILNIFVASLNEIHNIQMPNRYWRITIGPWLNWMVNVIYEKYHKLVNAKKHNAGELLVISPEELKTIAEDTYEFIDWINHDENYNLKVTNDVACFIGYPTKIHKGTNFAEIPAQKISQKQSKKSTKLRLYNLIMKQSCRYGEIFLYNTDYNKKSLFSLFLKSKGKIVDIVLPQKKMPDYNISYQLRKTFEDKTSYLTQINNTAEIFLVTSMVAAKNIPVCWLEGYKALEKYVFEEFPSMKKPKKIMSLTGWYFNESFKLWSASCAINGTELIGLQHGGNYGISKFHTSEKHEKSIVDRYVTWGWSSDYNDHSIICCTSAKIIEIKKRYELETTERSRNKILYIGTSGCRFLVDFITLPESFFAYHASQIDFFKNLHDIIAKNVVVRLHQEDIIWEIKERLLMLFPELKFEDWSLPFNESIHNAKLIVCDHLSTTYIQGLASNIPTLLFWDKSLVTIRDTAKKYFDELRRVGIFHESGKEASKFLYSIYEDIDGWWKSEELQSVVKTFCNNFAKKSSDPIQELFKILTA